MANKTYDVGEAFRVIENKLIDDIMTNLSSNSAKSTDIKNFAVEEMKRLEDFRLSSAGKYNGDFEEINEKVSEIIADSYNNGVSAEQRKILKAIQKGYKTQKVVDDVAVQSLNRAKLQALIKATTEDLRKAEHAVLRKAEDDYRKIIFNADVGLNSGALSYTEAIDMATQDFLSEGIKCIRYKNGSYRTISDYCDMAVKTANKKAYLAGEGAKRQEYGEHLVLVSNVGGNPCECCIPYIGEVLIDDVYSGGSQKDGDYVLLSEAMATGLFHPRCKDGTSTYFPGITDLPNRVKKDEKKRIEDENEKKRYLQNLCRQKMKYERLYKYSLDKSNKDKYSEKIKEVDEKIKNFQK